MPEWESLKVASAGCVTIVEVSSIRTLSQLKSLSDRNQPGMRKGGPSVETLEPPSQRTELTDVAVGNLGEVKLLSSRVLFRLRG